MRRKHQPTTPRERRLEREYGALMGYLMGCELELCAVREDHDRACRLVERLRVDLATSRKRQAELAEQLNEMRAREGRP